MKITNTQEYRAFTRTLWYRVPIYLWLGGFIASIIGQPIAHLVMHNEGEGYVLFITGVLLGLPFLFMEFWLLSQIIAIEVRRRLKKFVLETFWEVLDKEDYKRYKAQEK